MKEWIKITVMSSHIHKCMDIYNIGDGKSDKLVDLKIRWKSPRKW